MGSAAAPTVNTNRTDARKREERANTRPAKPTEAPIAPARDLPVPAKEPVAPAKDRP